MRCSHEYPPRAREVFFSLCRERRWGGGERSQSRRGAEGRRGSSARNLKWDPSLMMIWICGRRFVSLFVLRHVRPVSPKNRESPQQVAPARAGKISFLGNPRCGRRAVSCGNRGGEGVAPRFAQRRAARNAAVTSTSSAFRRDRPTECAARRSIVAPRSVPRGRETASARLRKPPS